MHNIFYNSVFYVKKVTRGVHNMILCVKILYYSEISDTSKFLTDDAIEIWGLINTALESRPVLSTFSGKQVYMYNFDKTIGRTTDGGDTAKLKVILKVGKLITAFQTK